MIDTEPSTDLGQIAVDHHQLRPYQDGLADDRQTLAEFYAHKGVFVTGGTGFIGTVLIEALLSTTPDIGKIYVLVRGKRGEDAENRIKKLLSKQVNALSLCSSITFYYITELKVLNETMTFMWSFIGTWLKRKIARNSVKITNY